MFFGSVLGLIGMPNPLAPSSELGGMYVMYSSMSRAVDAIKAMKNFDQLTFLDNKLNDKSIENKIIPSVYGLCIVDGKVLWASDIREQTNKISTGQIVEVIFRGTIPRPESTYYVDVAYIISLGEVDEVVGMYYGVEELELEAYNYTLYKGDSLQLPDDTIYTQSAEDKKTYRNICYIVFNNLNITDFGARVPPFSFKVKRIDKIRSEPKQVQQLVEAVNIIPGTGEFVLDTEIKTKSNGQWINNNFVTDGTTTIINKNSYESEGNVSDFTLAMQNLKKDIPSVKWVSPIVCWFGDNINANSCSVYPAVEYKYSGVVSPNDWSVAGISRQNAKQVVKDIKGNVRYGGTISDGSVVNSLNYMRGQGYQIMFYPMMMMDVANKPWRGHLTCNANEVQNFFRKAGGYNNFILHYANLVKGRVDAFVIGSEMIGLTKLYIENNGDRIFPAVLELKRLAMLVRQILGPDVKITYAADWSEYHHTEGGWYNMDELWADENIDFVGIDAYFPLTADISHRANIDEIIEGFESGEGYDYYLNWERTEKHALDKPYAWKNFRWFVENDHFNPNNTKTGKKTAWKAGSKKIWFTEYGFPSVDLCTNQPNVFYSEGSLDGGYPRNSLGYVDFASQQDAILAMELFRRKNSDILQNAFLWCWDARPFPHFPKRLDVWSDGANWKYGHWVNGKLNSSNLSDVLTDLCLQAGLKATQLDTSLINEAIDGFVINGSAEFESVLKMLSIAYLFEIVIENGVLKFIPLSSLKQVQIDGGDMLVDLQNNTQQSQIYQSVEANRITAVDLIFLDAEDNYSAAKASAEIDFYEKENRKTINLPIAMSFAKAKSVAELCLQVLNSSFEISTIKVCPKDKYLNINVMDIAIFKNANDMDDDFEGGANYGLVKAIEINEDGTIVLSVYNIDGSFFSLLKSYKIAPKQTSLNFLDEVTPSKIKTDIFINKINYVNGGDGNGEGDGGQNQVYVGVDSASPLWNGADVYFTQNNFVSYGKLASLSGRCVRGRVVSKNITLNASNAFIDYGSFLVVNLVVKSNTPMLQSGVIVFNGEIIRYNKCELLSENLSNNCYKLSAFQRGVNNTGQFLAEVSAGFLLINQNVKQIVLQDNMFNAGGLLPLRAVSKGEGVLGTETQNVVL